VAAQLSPSFAALSCRDLNVTLEKEGPGTDAWQIQTILELKTGNWMN
jgi:hypothetical protein